MAKKLVTRHILEQSRRNSDDLAAIKTRLDRVERKVDGLEQKLGSVESSLGGRIGSLERNLPKIVGDAVREVFGEHDKGDKSSAPVLESRGVVWEVPKQPEGPPFWSPRTVPPPSGGRQTS